jgi:hypothetical protein
MEIKATNEATIGRPYSALFSALGVGARPAVAGGRARAMLTPLAHRARRPPESNKPPRSLPTLRLGEHDRPRDDAPAAPGVISAGGLPRAVADRPDAQRPARTGAPQSSLVTDGEGRADPQFSTPRTP